MRDVVSWCDETAYRRFLGSCKGQVRMEFGTSALKAAIAKAGITRTKSNKLLQPGIRRVVRETQPAETLGAACRWKPNT
jgi:hypothetical protein